MKFPIPGFVSQALSSVINNDRRQKRIPFDEARKLEVQKTQYDFPEVSEEERKKVVATILRKRKKRLLLGKVILIVLLCGAILCMFVIISLVSRGEVLT